ncbi:MAG: TonB-dependent receptor [Prosthecobacter sp.]|nr:TonB-dependent receptor [Prosthecobacter sp.]
MLPRACFLFLFVGSFLNAAETKPFSLGAIVVTADRQQPLVDALADTISVETMRNLERTDLAEALRLSPGVTMSQTGPRNETGVNVRGFDLRQVPVFIDGIPVYVPYDGYVDLRRFTTADVAQIRVSKGFSSALYGANTLGGAINIVSRKPERPVEGDLLTGWFQEGGYQAALNVGFRQGPWYAQLSGSFLDADSYPLSDDFTSNSRENGGSRDNAYREDWRFSAKVGYTPNDTDEYALGYSLQRGEKGNPVYAGDDPLQSVRFWQWPRWDKQTVYLITQTEIAKDTYLKTRWYWDQFKNTLFAYDDAHYDSQKAGRSFQSFYDDWTVGGSLEIGTQLGANNTLKAAVHGKFDRHKEHNDGADFYTFEDMTWSLGLEDTHEFTDRFSAVAGLSYDRRSVEEAVDTNTGVALGGEAFASWNPQMGFFYDLTEAHRLHLTVARKSRFPTIKDRYSYRLGQAIPNSDLEPETAVHYELGYEGVLHDSLTVRANVFAAEIEDTIQRVDNVQPGRFQLQNVGESRHIGAEFGWDWKPNEVFQWTVNYAYLDRQNLSQPNVRLIDTPRHSFFTYAEIRPLNWLSVIPSVEYNGSRYSTSYGSEAGAWAIANLKVAVRLPHEITLSAGVNNVFDRNYALTEGYPEAGRVFFVNMKVEF